MNLHLSQIISIPDPTNYKLHAARWNHFDQPLDVFLADKDKWLGWNTWRNTKNEFNRDYIFSIIDYYHAPNIWLFGGIYKVLGRGDSINAHSYSIQEVSEFKPLVGRLKISLASLSRGRAFLLENQIENMMIHEVLPSIYTGEPFPGYENLDISFAKLCGIFKNQREDWKSALENIKGIYLITDISNGKRYVGSAYGIQGIWSRWACYVGTGHGGTNELTQLINNKGFKYAIENFKITLLEYLPKKTSDNHIMERESFWKNALLSRGRYGYNNN